ncbi:MAG TPA: M15 family metallopeptidase [Candidatus Saccharimonadales bacterium]
MSDNLQTKRILSYDDVVHFSAGDSTEPLVDVSTYDDTITTQYIKTDMVPITGEVIYVRDSIAKKLTRIEAALREKGYRLKVVYGYRHPEVQRKYFEKRRATIGEQNPKLTGEALDRYTHNFVAVPDIAGHPAGAAVDLTLIDIKGTPVDMGTGIADYSDEDKIKTFADNISDEQIANRKLLHDLMVKEGFAPFYGEWWHFSYGDREWAAFYNKKALYGAIDFSL